MPVMDRRSASLLELSPTDIKAIDAAAADTSLNIDARQVGDSFSAGRRGFGAIERLLFRDDAVAEATGSPGYCPYLLAHTQVAREESATILADWTVGAELGTPYQGYFTDRASLSLIPGDAVEEAVRTQVFLIRDIVHIRLATAFLRWTTGKLGFALAGIALLVATRHQWMVGGALRFISPLSVSIGAAMLLISIDALTPVHRVGGVSFVVWLVAIGFMLFSGRVERLFIARFGPGAPESR